MALPLEKTDRPFTYRDYFSWPDGEHWELIDGIPVAMSPAPMRRHQTISMNLVRMLSKVILPASRCKLYHAPFDVRLPEANEADDDIITVVQPDLVVICDPSKLDDRGCRGAPDLVIEILSPSTAIMDLQTKRDLYERHGVSEYWIVQPMERIVIIYLFQDGRFDRGSIFTEADDPSLRILPDVRISLKDVFAE